MFQDFHNFELLVGTSVGIGDLDRVVDDEAVLRVPTKSEQVDLSENSPMVSRRRSVDRSPTVRNCPGDSGRRWRSAASMCDVPLLQILDEPSASLDAATEFGVIRKLAWSGEEKR